MENDAKEKKAMKDIENLQETVRENSRKLNNFAKSLELDFSVDYFKFPVCFKFITSENVKEQLSFIENEMKINEINFTFKSELIVNGDFEIEEISINKLKNMCKKLYFSFLMCQFAETKLKNGGI